MCKDHDIYYNPISPTTIFRPSDTKAECLTTVTINNTIEFRWYYRSNSSKTWISCYNWSERALFAGEYHYAGYLLIAGHWPGLNYPRAYKVEAYLDGYLSFSEFFEVTNGGLNSPRTCENIDADEHPVNMKSRFTIGTDTNVYDYLSFDNIAYYNDELENCHNFTTVWIQPDGNTYKTFSRRFTDYKDTNTTWNCWKHGYTTDDYISINSSTPAGNWKVEVYLDDYYLNGTWIPYGPVSTTPFTVGSGPVADWTFMVYLDGDNSLESAAVETFLNLASVGSSTQVNIVVQMDRIGTDNRYGNWTDCKRFYITKGLTPAPENATLDLGEVNMGDPATLKDFVSWAMNDYPANRYFLVLWDHGAGFMGFCFDVTSGGDALTLPELNQALSGLPAIIDVVLIDACSTSMMEVAYQIKDYANVLIGPEDLGYEPAPYQDYLSSLTSNSTMSPNALAVEVVTDYIRWCFSVTNIQNATMSAIDLAKITSLAAAVDDFALQLKEEETPYHEQISLARSLTEGYQGPYANQAGYFIDLFDFARLTSQYVSDEELRNAADQLMTALSIGNTMIMDANKAHPNSHGLSILFADENEKYKSYESTYEETNFAIDTLWDEFIKYDLSGSVLTVQTPQPYVPVEIDNESYTADDYGKIHVFVLPQYHNVSVASSYLIGPGSRLIFAQWNDGDTSNPRTLFMNETLTLTAEYETQYRLLMDENFGTTDPDIGEHWYNASSIVPINAIAPIAASGEQFLFVRWTGTGTGSYSGTTNPASVTMGGPINETATWKHEYYLAVTSSYGSSVPTSGWFEAGEPITVSVTSPISGSTGTQYVCTGWNGTGSASTSGANTLVNFTINQASSIAWNWKTQYHVVVGTDPAGLDPQPKPSSPGPWYDGGTLLICTAQNISSKLFDHWTVKSLTTDQLSDWEHGISQITLTIDGPYEAVAHYVPAPAWWNNVQIILALAGVLTASFVGAAWITTRRRKGVMKPLPEPTATKLPKVVLPGRIMTGYEDLDDLLFGGIPENYAVALTSISCDERDLLIKRFLEVGIRKGEVAFYIAANIGEVRSLVEEFQSGFYVFICNPRADAMIESLPNVFKLNGVENLTEINIALTKAFRALDTSPKGARRACIEILSDVLLQHHAVQTRRWLADLIPDLRSRGFTTLAVMNPQMHPSQEVQAILDLFDGEINIFEREPQKLLKIKKMVNQKYLDSELPIRKERLEG